MCSPVTRPVDPTDTAEGLTFEQLDATKVLVYTDPDERLAELRAEIIAEGVAAFIARNPGVSRSAQCRWERAELRNAKRDYPAAGAR
jgi:hypothetical protein